MNTVSAVSQNYDIRQKAFDHLAEAARLAERAEKTGSNETSHAYAAVAQIHINAAVAYGRLLQ